MHVPFSILILVLLIEACYTLSIPVTPNLNAPLNLITLDNGTTSPTLGIRPPRELSTISVFEGTKLNSTSCLLNALYAQKTLALRDFQGKILNQELYGLPGSDVVIAIIPSTSDETLERRSAMWAILRGVSVMNAENKYESLEVSILWNEKRIGWVLFYSDPKSTVLKVDGRIGSNDAMIDGRQSAAPSSVVNTINTLGAIDESRVKMIWKQFDVNFSSLYDVISLIMNSLIGLAAHVKTERVQKWHVRMEGIREEIAMERMKRPSTPFLEYQWIIIAVARIPEYMLSVGRLCYVWMTIFLDDVGLAWGSFGRDPGIHESASRFNLTLS